MPRYKKMTEKKMRGIKVRNRVLLASMEKDKNIPKGSLLQVKEKLIMNQLEADTNEFGIFTKEKLNSYNTKLLKEKEIILFLDVVFDPHLKRHFFRFLVNEKIMGLEFIKGEMGRFDKHFTLLNPGSYSVDNNKKKTQ